MPNRPATSTRIVVASSIVHPQFANRVSARRNEPDEPYALVGAGDDSTCSVIGAAVTVAGPMVTVDATIAAAIVTVDTTAEHAVSARREMLGRWGTSTCKQPAGAITRQA
jgi:hypothetical protein